MSGGTDALTYHRVLLKLSGEALGGASGRGFDPTVLSDVSREIAALRRLGVQVAVVVGGGNFLRGAELSALGFDRVGGDRMGMLATVLNALAMVEALGRAGVPARAWSALEVRGVVDLYRREAVSDALEAGQTALLAGGTGNPFFSTDSAAALRAAELGADALLKATKVDGVYDRDPLEDPAARRFDRLTYDEVLERELGVMDLTAITLCKENRLPIVVFDANRQGALADLARGRSVGTIIAA